MKLTYLPEVVVTQTGKRLTHRTSYSAGLYPSKDDLIAKAKSIGAAYRCVEVLETALRDRRDLHDKQYQGSTWILSDKPLRD